MTYLEKRGCQFAYFKRCSGNVANEGFVRMPAGTEKYSTVTTFTVVRANVCMKSFIIYECNQS